MEWRRGDPRGLALQTRSSLFEGVLTRAHRRRFIYRPIPSSGDGFANLLGCRIQKGVSEIGVVDRPRQEHLTDHGRENGHGLAAGFLAVGLADPTAEHLEVFPDPGFE